MIAMILESVGVSKSVRQPPSELRRRSEYSMMKFWPLLLTQGKSLVRAAAAVELNEFGKVS